MDPFRVYGNPPTSPLPGTTKGIIPVKKYADALHIAVSTYYEMDALLSWNYRHLANIQKKKKIIANLEQGYEKFLELITPMEVMNDDQE